MLTALAIFAALTAIVQVVMSFARTRPEDAKQSLGEWAKSFHLDRLARWLNAHRADQWVLRYGPKDTPNNNCYDFAGCRGVIV
jgi:hypothetical protein